MKRFLLVTVCTEVGHYDSGHAVDHGYGYNAGHLMNFEGTHNFSFKLLYYIDYDQVKKIL